MWRKEPGYIPPEKNIGAELLTRSRVPLELYPYWMVTLPLDDYYPGNVISILVTVWADTSEIIDCFPLSAGGEFLVDNTTANSSPEESTTLQQFDSSLTTEPSEPLSTKEKDSRAKQIETVPIAIAIIIIVVIAIGAVLKKGRFVKKC